MVSKREGCELNFLILLSDKQMQTFSAEINRDIALNNSLPYLLHCFCYFEINQK